MANLKVRTATFNAPTSTGTQDLTISGMGRVDAVILRAVNATTLDVEVDGLSFSCGVWADGAATYGCVATADDHGETDTTNDRELVQGSILRLITGDGTILAEADVVSDVSDGIQINWTTVGSAYLIQATFFHGDALHADIVEYDQDAGESASYRTTDMSDIGFEPDLVFSIMNGATDEVSVGNFENSWGVARNGTSIEQFSATWECRDADPITLVVGTNSDSNIGQILDNNVKVADLSITSFNNDGLTLQNTTGTGGATIHGFMLALRIQGHQTYAGVHEAYTLGGIGDQHLVCGFQAQFADIAQTTHLALDNVYTGPGRTGGMAFGVTDEDTNGSVVRAKVRDNSATTDTHTRVTDRQLLGNESGNNTHDLEGSVSSFAATQVNISYSARPGETGQCVAWAVEENVTLPVVMTINLGTQGLGSTASLGTPTLTPGPVTIPLDGLASTATLGTHTVAPGAAPLPLPGIASVASLGVHTLSPGAAVLPLVGIASVSVLGTPTITPGSVQLTLDGLASVAVLGTPTLAAGAVVIPLVGIASTGSLGTPTVSPDAAVIPMLGIPSTGAFGTMMLEPGAAPLPLVGIASVASLGLHTVAPGSTDIILPGIPSTGVLGTPELSQSNFPQTIPMVGIPSTGSLGVPALQIPAIDGAVQFHIITQSSPSSTGTQDFTVSGAGDPQLVVFVATFCEGSDASAEDAGLSMGMLDSAGNQGCGWVNAKHDVGTSDTRYGTTGAKVVVVKAPGGVPSDLAAADASFDSFITDGVRISWDHVFLDTISVTAYMWFGDIVATVGAVDGSDGNPPDAQVLGYRPHQLLAVGSRGAFTSASLADSDDATMTLGIAQEVEGVLQQRSTALHWEDNQSTQEVRGINSETHIAQRGGDFSPDAALTVTAFSGTGFTLSHTQQGASSTNNGRVGILYAAIKYPDNYDYWSDFVDIDGTSPQLVDPPAFEPEGSLAMGSAVTTYETHDTSSAAGAFGFGGFDGTTAKSYAVTARAGSDPSDCLSHQSDSFFRLPLDTGAGGWTADVAFGSLEFTNTGGSPVGGMNLLTMAWGLKTPDLEIPLVGIASTSSLGTPFLELGPPPQPIPLLGIPSTGSLGTPELIRIDLDMVGIAATSVLGVIDIQVDPQLDDSKMARANTLRLEAINTMLSVTGDLPVDSLAENVPAHVRMAEQILNETMREVQSIGWNYNTIRGVTYTPDTSQRIYLPSDVIWAVDEGRDTNVTLRGRTLFNVTDNSLSFSSSMCLTIRVCLDWDSLPEPARRYIIVRSSRVFQQRLVGSVKLDGFTSRDEDQAHAALRQFDNTEAQYDLRSNKHVANKSRRQF